MTKTKVTVSRNMADMGEARQAYEIWLGYESGRKWALGLKVDDPFIGAVEASEFTRGTVSHRMFIYGALDILEQRKVILDAETGLIVEFGYTPESTI